MSDSSRRASVPPLFASARATKSPDFFLLEGACPNAKLAGPRKLATIFCTPDGQTQHMGKRTANEIHSLFPPTVTGQLWRDLRPLLDTTEYDFKLFIRSNNAYAVDQSATTKETVNAQLANTGGVQWIAIRTDFVSALIEPKRVLFILNQDENAIFSMFLSEFQCVLPTAGRFDHVTLDALLAASLKIHKTRFQIFKPVAMRIFGEIASTTSEDSIARLFPVRRCLMQFKERLRPMNAVLQNFVWEKDDPNADFEDTTDVLHPWLDGVGEVVADVNEVMEELDDTERFINASMNSARNRYLVLEIFVAIITLSFSFGSLLSGIFGMNLKSGWEEINGGVPFISTVAIIVLASLCINFGGYWYFVRSRPAERFGKLVKFGDGKFFANFNNDEYLFSLTAANVASEFPRPKKKSSLAIAVNAVPIVWRNRTGSPLAHESRSSSPATQ